MQQLDFVADASYLEDLLRGRRLLVLAGGDPRSASHLAARLETQVVICDGDEGVLASIPSMGKQVPVETVLSKVDVPLPFGEGEFEAVVAFGKMAHSVHWICKEARRVVSADGVVALGMSIGGHSPLESLMGRTTLSSSSGATVGDVRHAQESLAESFDYVWTVDRCPYIGYHFVQGRSGDSTRSQPLNNGEEAGVVTLDSVLVEGLEEPTGALILASNDNLLINEALVQLPSDRLVQRISSAMQHSSEGEPSRELRAMRRDLAERGERAEAAEIEVRRLRKRSYLENEGGERARGEARKLQEKISLLEVEVARQEKKSTQLQALRNEVRTFKQEALQVDAIKEKLREMEELKLQLGAANERNTLVSAVQREADELRESLQQSEGRLKESEAALAEKSAKIAALESELDRLQDQGKNEKDR